MSTNFQIEVKRGKDNLYITPKGDFDGSSAWELVNLLDKQYNGKGQVVIDTHNLCEMCPFGCSTFRCLLNVGKLPSNRLIFKGEKGYELAPEGYEVFESTEKHNCRCNGNCANCSCSEKKQQN